MSEAALDRALDEVVPTTNGADDWNDVLRRAGVRGPRRQPPRRTVFLVLGAAVLLALAAVVVAAVVTRTSIVFSHAKPAPNVIKKQFLDRSNAPGPFALKTLAAQAREVGSFDLRGRKLALWVAPNRGGGFCFVFEHGFGSCSPSDSSPGAQRLGAIAEVEGVTRVPVITAVGGWVLGARTTTVQIEYQDGSHDTASLVYVSKPIDAAFFLYGISKAHLKASTRVTGLVATDKDGHVIGRWFAPRPGPLPPNPVPTHPTPPRLPPVPRPSAPFQRATADGVSVVVGANEVATFDARKLTAHARALLSPVLTYSCFRFVREFGILGTRGGGFTASLAPVVRLRLDGVSVPVDGCELTGSYGHRWPDRNDGHAPVEIALSPRGRRFFADRAVARDLGSFVRSPNVRRIRAESDRRLSDDLSRYPIRALRSATARFSARHLGYVRTAEGVVFVEWSPTGKRFFVQVLRGKIKRSNLEPYAWVF